MRRHISSYIAAALALLAGSVPWNAGAQTGVSVDAGVQTYPLQNPGAAPAPQPVAPPPAVYTTNTPPPVPQAAPARPGNGPVPNGQPAAGDTFDQGTILHEAEGVFGKGAEGLAAVLEKAFKDLGQPNGYIKGQEAGGALVVGLRYGDGVLILKNGVEHKLHWQGPSLGFDIGGNASKVFTLVYNLPTVDSIFQRFPGVDGSLYFVGGFGLNYLQSDQIVLAPIRLGVGWRAGINVGYMNIRREKSWNPF